MAQGLRIAFLNSWPLDPARGSGTAVGVAGLARGLSALGHRVALLAPRLPAPGLTLRRLLYNLEVPSRLSADAFDLVVGFDIDGFLYSPPPGRAYAVCLQGIAAEEMTFESGWPRAHLKFLSRLERRNARRARRVVVPSEHSRRAAAALYGLPAERLAVVPEGIDLAPWDALLASRPPREAAPPVILSVARQYPRKNTRALVAAMPAVREAVPGARLRVVGGGPMLPALKAQALSLGLGGCVEFLGELAGEEAVRREYLGADVFCLPSLQEGFGIVYLEAMAAGLPIVALRAAATPEVAAEGEVALLAPPRDEAALAGALIRLLRDGPLRARLGAAGRRRARRYGWGRVAQRFLEEVAERDEARRGA